DEFGYSSYNLVTSCPKCEKEVVPEHDAAANRIIEYTLTTNNLLDKELPYYSEIGILFEMEGEPYQDSEPYIITGNGKTKELPKPIIQYENEINFKEVFYESEHYSVFQNTPYIIASEVAVIKTENGIRVVKSNEAVNPSLSTILPVSLQSTSIMEIKGKVSEGA
ncbi:hypothetical protein, partial [Acinetobacter baumannii]|uniref:hypothetical protein n=1 Tax=Acinetobacter baumannii TaxID=470 RepID=UPI000AF887A4